MNDAERIANTDDETIVRAWHANNVYVHERTLEEFLDYNKDAGWDEETLRGYFEQMRTEDDTVFTVESGDCYEALGWGDTEEDAWFSAADSIRYGTEDENIIRALDIYEGVFDDEPPDSVQEQWAEEGRPWENDKRESWL